MIRYSIGNRKIGKDTLIINMGSARQCPSGKAGLCHLFDNGKCYAMKAERLYPQVLPYRYSQARYWKRYDAQKIASDLLLIIARKPEIKYIRFNESGDFYSQDCVDKLSVIADALVGRAKVYTYTHRRDLNYSKVSKNLTVNGSGFMIHNNFKTVTAYGVNRIRCLGDCSTCKICYERRNVVIDCKQH